MGICLTKKRMKKMNEEILREITPQEFEQIKNNFGFEECEEDKEEEE